MNVLLDFDGVVLRRHPLFLSVKRRVRQYVQKYIDIKSPSKLDEINEQLYQSSGHTVLGLRRLGIDASARDFNRYVYGFIHHPALENLEKESRELLAVARACERNGAGLYVFSNAPDYWVCPFLERMRLGGLVRTLSDVTGDYLKPELACYERVEEHFNDDSKLVFVDDKLCNLIPVSTRSRWVPVMFSDSPQDAKSFSIRDRISVVSRLSDLL